MNVNPISFGKTIKVQNEKLLQGLDDCVNIPHSRHSTVKKEDIAECKALKLLLYSEESL